jgi:hypothetical protein
MMTMIIITINVSDIVLTEIVETCRRNLMKGK